MRYQLVYTRRAVKDIKKLDHIVQKRLKKSLEKFIKKPFNYSNKLNNAKLGEYRFRVGDYRIIFDKKWSDIIILRVGHRREIYK